MIKMKIEVSHGEIIDKYTILQIKKEKCEDASKLKNIQNELNILIPIVKGLNLSESLIDELRNINLKLWEIEDLIRVCEHEKKFDSEFIQLARSVYITNDLRFKVKSQINKITKSSIVEEKILPKYLN
jgi:hypothetical protein